MESNYGFPNTDFQKQAILGIGRDHTNSPQEWAQRLNRPKTGISLGITDFGNINHLGLAFTTMPIIEFNVFGSERIKLLNGLGVLISLKNTIQ